MADESKALATTFPPEVHESMLALRRQAQQVKSLAEWKATGRYATAEEIAVSESLREPHHCSGHSARTGLACTLPRGRGMTCCRKHGGSVKKTKAKAAMRLRAMVDPVLDNLLKLATQTDNPAAAVKACQDWLDRAGIGELVEAKVRSSHGKDAGGQVVVNIGFLSDGINRQPDIVVRGNEGKDQ